MSRRDARSVALALDGMTLIVLWRSARAHGAWRWESVPCDATPDGIAAALDRLGEKTPVGSAVNATLLRPLANARTIAFPGMAQRTLEGVLTRDWTRHVIGVRATPHTAAARRANRGEWRTAFAPTDTLDAIGALAAANEWHDVITQTSDDALAVAVRELGTPDEKRAPELVVVVCDDDGPTDAVYLRRGEPVLGRRFRAGASDDDAVVFIDTASAHAHTPVVVVGASPRAAALARTIGANGRHARVLDIGVESGTPAAAIIAIAGAQGHATMQLLSASARVLHGREMARITRWLWIAAAAALFGAFAIERWGVGVALADVQQQRADISPQVSNAMRTRVALEADVDAAATLGEREAAASRASGVVAAIAAALPPGTALTALNVAGDSVTVEGESRRSAAVYDALRSVPALEQVRLAAPLRQERQANDDAIERFAFNARIRGAAGVPR